MTPGTQCSSCQTTVILDTKCILICYINCAEIISHFQFISNKTSKSFDVNRQIKHVKYRHCLTPRALDPGQELQKARVIRTSCMHELYDGVTRTRCSCCMRGKLQVGHRAEVGLHCSVVGGAGLPLSCHRAARHGAEVGLH